MLKTTGLTFSYPGSSEEIISGVEVELQPSQFVVVLGSLASGKTTLARLLAGLLEPIVGQVEVDSFTFPSPEARRRVFLLFENPDNQFVGVSLGEDVAFGPRSLGCSQKEVKEKVMDALKEVGLDYPLATPLASLSGGEKQKASLAGALATSPRYLLSDEVTSYLDPTARKEMLTLFKKLAEKGCGVLHFTHLIEETFQADKVGVLNKGRVGWLTREQFFSKEDFLNALGLTAPSWFPLVKVLVRKGREVNSMDDFLEAVCFTNLGG